MSNMIINTNVLALNAHRALKFVGQDMALASRRLSSGLRINSASDDASGLAISEKMRSQIRGLDQASQNAQDAISLFQTAEGGMQEIENMLQRIRELTVKASNDTNEHNAIGTGDRQKIQDELDQLVQEIDSMAERVEFNRKKVISGDFANPEQAVVDREVLVEVRVAEEGAAASAQVRRADDNGAAQTALTLFTTTYTNYTDYQDALVDFDDADVALELDWAGTFGPMASAAMAEINTYVVAGESPFTGNYNRAEVTAYFIANPNTIAAEIADAGNTYHTAVGAFDTLVTTFQIASDDLNTAANVWSNDTAGRNELRNLQNSVKASSEALTGAAEDLNQALTRVNQAENILALAANARNEANASGPKRDLYFQIGANAYQSLITNIGQIKSDLLGIGNGMGSALIDVRADSGKDITGWLDTIDYAISYVSAERSKMG
ncbi:MAG: hypothetical protein LBL35_04160, partial [Clostridiales bacterium]|nr:hypothetical protein [Clostridiales bacterium]